MFTTNPKPRKILGRVLVLVVVFVVLVDVEVDVMVEVLVIVDVMVVVVLVVVCVLVVVVLVVISTDEEPSTRKTALREGYLFISAVRKLSISLSCSALNPTPSTRVALMFMNQKLVLNHENYATRYADALFR